MNTPIAAMLWPEHARQDLNALLRMVAHLERCCLEMGADEAAERLAEAATALMQDGANRRLAA